MELWTRCRTDIQGVLDNFSIYMNVVVVGKVQILEFVDFCFLVAENAKYKRMLSCSLRGLYIQLPS